MKPGEPFYVPPCSATDRGEIRQNLSVFLLALGEAPPILVQVGVEIIQHGNLLVQRDSHVVLDGVQRSQHQVENTNCMPGSERHVTSFKKKKKKKKYWKIFRLSVFYTC